MQSGGKRGYPYAINWKRRSRSEGLNIHLYLSGVEISLSAEYERGLLVLIMIALYK